MRREPLDGNLEGEVLVNGRVEGEKAFIDGSQGEEDEVDSAGSTDTDEDIDESVMEEMQKLEESFVGISRKYRLINRIGEGTFSTVYKAEALPQPEDEASATDSADESSNVPRKRRRTDSYGPQRKGPARYVALKKIYVTSSPIRIQNELELLHDLRGCHAVCPLITAFRYQDQVVAVLPYFRHLDFRIYYKEFMVSDMRDYFRSLFSALHAVHKHNILHRDIKPTNFLYDHNRREGVLVDFGLAERQGTDWAPCLCLEEPSVRRHKYVNLFGNNQPNSTGYPKNDSRPSKRANRAGTRGFRAPEVLFKCASQTTKIDIWSAGVILLTLLARRFPFFNSADDVDAMIELSSIFGKKRMKAAAMTHGSVYETNIDTIGIKGFPFEKIITWSSCREQSTLSPAEKQAIRFLEALLELDPSERLTAKQALRHEFFTKPVLEEQYEVVHEEEREQMISNDQA